MGHDVPPSIHKWSDLTEQFKLRQYLVRNIEKSGYTEPTPVQKQTIPSMINNREVIVAAPTGSGKTAAYVVPLLHLLGKPGHGSSVRVLVVLPTNELASQVKNEFSKLTAGKPFKICLLKKTDVKLNNIDVIITTPNRLIHVIKQQSVKLTNVAYLILDECDTLLSANFLSQMDEIIAACGNPNILVSLFSATISPPIEDLAKTFMKDPIRIVVGAKNAVVEQVNQKLIYTGSEDGKLVALRRRIREGIKPPVLVFVQSKERAEELFREFVYENINVDFITSDRTQAQREKTTQKFREGKIWFLIATNLMSRGMDFKGINLVINYDLPTSATDYIHRVGRTGRMGKYGEAETYYTDDDLPYLRRIANVIKQSGQDVPNWLLKIKSVDKKTSRKMITKPLERERISTAILEDQTPKRKKNKKKYHAKRLPKNDSN